ncbi:uncharacterized protein FYW61_016270 isoform 2-T2 [Anableps anableps]
MSRPRSRSPHYRRFPWEEPDFDPRKVIAELDGNPRDRGHHFREGPEDFRDSYREEHYPEGPRRSPFRDDPRFRHQRHPDHDEFFHHVAMRFENRRFSPRDEDFEGDRHRGEFRDDFKRFDDRGGRPPPLLPGLSPNLRSYADHQQRKAGMGWRREEQGRFRDFSPGMRSGDQRAEVMEKGGRFPQHANRGRHQHYDRGPRFKRQRWEMDVIDHPGPLCYSSDRQLSLDLVNVGRQRLDFLPLLEHSGTYRESAAHTGTFAQEIITLVHFVKEQYFRGDGVTLNQRFSAPQKGGYSEEELEELTLNQRFSSNRGFSLNMDSLLDDEDDEPLFFKLGSMQEAGKQPLRGPGDLRHDLERRRQEKLEAVKVTIAGSGLSQRSQGESDGFWPGEQNRRREGSMGSRRGAYNRPTMGPQRRNNHFGNQRQNLHSNPPGPNW